MKTFTFDGAAVPNYKLPSDSRGAGAWIAFASWNGVVGKFTRDYFTRTRGNLFAPPRPIQVGDTIEVAADTIQNGQRVMRDRTYFGVTSITPTGFDAEEVPLRTVMGLHAVNPVPVGKMTDPKQPPIPVTFEAMGGIPLGGNRGPALPGPAFQDVTPATVFDIIPTAPRGHVPDVTRQGQIVTDTHTALVAALAGLDWTATAGRAPGALEAAIEAGFRFTAACRALHASRIPPLAPAPAPIVMTIEPYEGPRAIVEVKPQAITPAVPVRAVSLPPIVAQAVKPVADFASAMADETRARLARIRAAQAKAAPTPEAVRAVNDINPSTARMIGIDLS